MRTGTELLLAAGLIIAFTLMHYAIQLRQADSMIALAPGVHRIDVLACLGGIYIMAMAAYLRHVDPSAPLLLLGQSTGGAFLCAIHMARFFVRRKLASSRAG